MEIGDALHWAGDAAVALGGLLLKSQDARLRNIEQSARENEAKLSDYQLKSVEKFATKLDLSESFRSLHGCIDRLEDQMNVVNITLAAMAEKLGVRTRDKSYDR